MRKKLIGILSALLLCISLAIPVPAQSSLPLLVDDADLLTDGEERDLLEKLEEVSLDTQMDVVVVTVSGTQGKTPVAYADDFYDFNGYRADGILLLISMEERDWYISTSGSGITAFTDAGIAYMSEQFLDDLSEGRYYEAFITYASLCSDFVSQAEKGAPYDVGNLPKKPYPVVPCLIASLLIAFLISLIITGVMRMKLRSVRYRKGAAEYIKDDSMVITRARDIYLYRNVIRQEKPKESRSGGSSIHTSSSGSVHGGGGGKF